MPAPTAPPVLIALPLFSFSPSFERQYTSQHLRQWSSLLKAYERDHIFLGEGARLLVQAVAYACPALKKTKAQYDKQRTDCR